MDQLSNFITLLIGMMSLHWLASQINPNYNPPPTGTDITKKVSLASFIEDNHKLITTLGALTAITVFVSNVSLKAIGYVLAFLFLTGTVLLWLELWSRFPKPATNRLIFFENVFSLAVMVLIAYWVLEFRIIWRQLLGILLMLTFLWLFSLIIKRFNLYEFLLRIPLLRHPILRYLLGTILIVSAFALGITFSYLLAPLLNALLDELRRQLEALTITTP